MSRAFSISGKISSTLGGFPTNSFSTTQLTSSRGRVRSVRQLPITARTSTEVSQENYGVPIWKPFYFPIQNFMNGVYSELLFCCICTDKSQHFTLSNSNHTSSIMTALSNGLASTHLPGSSQFWATLEKEKAHPLLCVELSPMISSQYHSSSCTSSGSSLPMTWCSSSQKAVCNAEYPHAMLQFLLHWDFSKSLIVCSIHWDQFAMGDPTRGYFPRQQSSKDHRDIPTPTPQKGGNLSVETVETERQGGRRR